MTAVTIMFICSMAIAALGLAACYEGARLVKKCYRLERMNDGQRAALDQLQWRCWELEEILEEKGA